MEPGPFDLERALLECAREPIHIPGATQSFGTAIVVDVTSRITHVSSSSERHVGASPEVLLGANVGDVLAGALAEAWSRVASLRPDQVTNLRTWVGGKELDVAVWRRPDGAAVLSLSAATDDVSTPVMEELADLQRGLARTQSLQEVCDRTTTIIAALANYDRVMIYKFDAEGDGLVVSEARSAEADPFLGLQYPASDIPTQARALYLRNRTRVLADTRAIADPLLAVDPSAPPADLSSCLVRAHSRVHVQYLENMGVRATLTVSIVTDGQLWGLVACHHLTPRTPSSRTRLLCELLSDVIAVRIQLEEESARHQALATAEQAHHDMLRRLATWGASWAEVVASEGAEPRLTEVVPSAGAACLSGGVVHVIGETPPAETIKELPALLEPRLVDGMFHASRADEIATLAAHPGVASGIVAVRMHAESDAWLFWFRPAEARRVTWAGDQRKSVRVEQGVARLSPRQSFAAWTEEQQGRAAPWTPADLACARRVRESLIDLLLQIYAKSAQAVRLDLLGVRRACEAAGQPLAVLDIEGSPTFLNSAWATLFGPSWPGIVGGSPLGTVFVDASVRAALPEVVAGRLRSYVGESDVVGPTGKRVRVGIDAVSTDAGLPAGAVIVVTDLTERNRAEEMRRQLQQRAEGADRMEALALVTGTVAHDFNNLLTGILCEAALLAEDTRPEAPQRDGLEQIQRTARRAADLCRQLLDYSGKGTFVVRRTDLVALARDVVVVLGSIIPSNVTTSVRSSADSIHVVIDAIQIRQVLMNLLVNAADASTGGPAAIEVTIDAARLETPSSPGNAIQTLAAGDYVVLRVRDHGAGIPETVRRRIFEPFYTTKPTGKGLGLAAVLGIVRSHQGAIEVESQVGEGACFSMWLPAAPVAVHAAPPATVTLPGAKCVLVVEDDAQARSVVRRILERAGYVVVATDTVAQACAALANAELTISLVFTDLRLPDGSGRDVLRAAALRNPELPVVLASGMSDAIEPLSAATPNLVGFLPKPYDRGQLLAAIEKGVRGR